LGLPLLTLLLVYMVFILYKSCQLMLVDS
jgi:hypothetical protein